MSRPFSRTLCLGRQSCRTTAATQKNEYDDATPAPADKMCRVLFLSMHLFVKRLLSNRRIDKSEPRHNLSIVPGFVLSFSMFYVAAVVWQFLRPRHQVLKEQLIGFAVSTML